MSPVPFRFYLVSHRARMGTDPAGAVAALVRAGLTAFQWREKDLSPVENLSWLREILDAVQVPAQLAGGTPARQMRDGSRAEPVAGDTAATAPTGDVHYPWQMTRRTGPSETRESIIHHRAPHGLSDSAPPPAAPSQAAHSDAGVLGSTASEEIRGRFSLFVNDRADLALAAGCHLHLAEASIPTIDARRILAADRLVGRSTHSLDGALHAARDGADFITFGPVYETASKLGYGPPQGLARLHDVCAAVEVPVFAIGGVTPDRVGECLDVGAHGFAAIGAVWESSDPIAALRTCLDALVGS